MTRKEWLKVIENDPRVVAGVLFELERYEKYVSGHILNHFTRVIDMEDLLKKTGVNRWNKLVIAFGALSNKEPA